MTAPRRLLPAEPPFLVVAAGFLLNYHERGDRCTRCRDDWTCPRVDQANRIMRLHRQALRIVRTGL